MLGAADTQEGEVGKDLRQSKVEFLQISRRWPLSSMKSKFYPGFNALLPKTM